MADVDAVQREIMSIMGRVESTHFKPTGDEREGVASFREQRSPGLSLRGPRELPDSYLCFSDEAFEA